MTARVVLDEAAFRLLVAGRVVELRTSAGEDVDVILSDIGEDRIKATVEDVFRATGVYRDTSYPPRACDYCRKEYWGPAIYCSIDCALADR